MRIHNDRGREKERKGDGEGKKQERGVGGVWEGEGGGRKRGREDKGSWGEQVMDFLEEQGLVDGSVQPLPRLSFIFLQAHSIINRV